MPTTGNWLLVRRLVTTALYKLLRLVFITVQRIYWLINGTAQKQRDARLKHNYQRSAQVLDVFYCFKFCRSQPTTVDNFLCTHNRFEDPQYIIDNNNITLMTINEQDAVFCETEEKGMHLWRSKYAGFINEAQRRFCHRLIVVPLSVFHRMAETIGDPDGQLIFMIHTSRCGSTLLTQVMECTGRCVALSQPTSPTIVGRMYRQFGDSPELRQLARDVIRWDCRPYPSIQPPPLAYFLKTHVGNCTALPLFRELFPASRCLFMYRDIIAGAKSRYRQSMVEPGYRLNFLLGRLSGQLTKLVFDSMGYNNPEYYVRMDNDLTFGVLLWALSTATYLDMRRRGVDVRAVRYEDLIARPLDVCRAVLEFCRLPVSLAEDAVKALNVDSQRNSVMARSIIAKFKEPELTPEKKEKLNQLLKQFGVPLIGEQPIIEGTLTCS